jgi:hypothetical protein
VSTCAEGTPARKGCDAEAALGVATCYSTLMRKLSGVPHLPSMADYSVVRIEALFRHPPGLRAADAASLPNFVKFNAEVGLIPQGRGPAAASGFGSKKYSLCATDKCFGTRTVEASNKT